MTEAGTDDGPLQWRVLRGTGRLEVPGARRVASDVLELPNGRRLLALSPPRRREWQGVRLVRDEAVASEPTVSGWQVAGPGELDVLDLPVGVSPDEPATALTILGAFSELDDARSLGRFLVGGQVLDPTVFGGARCPSEQTALGLYRAARRRGGVFWDGAAGVVADWTATRVAQPRLVHDLLGHAETHSRFVADAVLLLAAAGDEEGTARAMTHLDAMANGVGGDRWWRHDSLEDGSDLVLNTHVQALLTRRAVGIVDGVGVAALHRALHQARGARSIAHAADLVSGDVVRGLAPPGSAWAGRLAHGSEVRAARERHRHPHLVLPGGRTARDVRIEPSPAYHTVNTADLASYALVTGDRVVRRAATAASDYARRSGHWRGLLRDRQPVTLLVPVILSRLGADRAARRWAARLQDQGWAPAIGWPDHIDRPWPRLPAGAL